MALTPQEEAELKALREQAKQWGGNRENGIPARARRVARERADATNLPNTARSVLQGATLGFGDELTAGVRSIVGDEDYDTALEDERAKIAAFNRDNYIPSLLTEGLGGVLTGGLGGLGRMAAARAAPAAVRDMAGGLSNKFTKMPMAVQTGAIGAGTGAVAGFGQGEGDFGDRALNAVPSTLAGFTLGAGVPVVGGAGRALVGAMSRSAPEKAERSFIRRMEADDLTPDQLAFQTSGEHAIGVPSTFATQGPNLTSLAEGVANIPGAGMATSRRAIEQLHRGQGERISQAVHTRTGAGDYTKKASDIDSVFKKQATPLYEKAYAVPVNMMDKDVAGILQLIPKDDLAKASAAAQKVYTSDPLNIGKPPREFFKFKKDSEGNVIDVDFPIDMNTAEWHAFIRGLREVKDGLNKNSAAHAKNFNEAYKNLDRKGKEKNPLFAEAQKIYSDAKSVEEAMADGRKAMFSYMTPDQMKKQLAGLSKNEQEHYRAGAVQALDEKLARQADGANKAASLVNTGHIRNKLRAITPDVNEFEALLATLQTEARDASARARMTMGSPTASRTETMRQVQEEDEFLPQVVEAVKGPTQFAMRWLSAKAKGLGLSSKTSDELAPMLHTADPAEQANILKRLRERQAQMAKETEQANTGYRIGAGAFGAMAGAPTMQRELDAFQDEE